MPPRSLSAATDNPAGILRANMDRRVFMPDIVEWVTSDRYLNRPNIYPRQLTLLKAIFLQDEIMTPFDYDVLEEWALGFRPPPPPGEDDTTMRWQGDWGIVPDVLDRMKILKSRGHQWFRVVLAIMGRRSGKGYIGGICASYILGHYIHMADPKSAFGVDADKRLSCQVFAGKKAQARDNQWRDIVSVIHGSPFLQNYISISNTEQITMYTPRDIDRATMLRAQEVDSEMDLASIEIVPKEATTMAARGPAAFMQFYDEGAHMVASGQSRSMSEVWEAATPALDQFKQDAFIYSGSSPWAMMGKFYELAQQTLEVDTETYKPTYPENMLIQLASWDIYKDWERTADRQMVAAPARTAAKDVNPDGSISTRTIATSFFRPLRQAIQEYNQAMVNLERVNPDTFKVERRSKWATALDAYFPAEHIDRMFQPWNERTLTQRLVPEKQSINYFAHGDPGKCLTGESLVYSTEGIMKIVQVRDGDVLANAIGVDEVERFVVSGEKPIFKLRLKYGYEVRGSEDHPVLTQRGWVRLADLITSKSRSQRGNDPLADQVMMRMGGNIWATEMVKVLPIMPLRRSNASVCQTPDVVDDDLGRLFGYLVAEGGVRENSVSVTCNVGESIADECIAIIRDKFGLEPSKEYTRGRARTVYWYNSMLMSVVGSLGLLPAHSRDKEIPWSILQSPASVVSQFLSAYFEGDGTVSKTTAKDRVAQATTASVELARQIQVVLLNFGIVSQRDSSLIKYNADGDTHRYWNVTMRGESLLRFRDAIGFRSDVKRSRLDGLCDFPVITLPDDLWLPAWSVDADGVEMTYDLTMCSGEHNFAANGIICHNTGSNFGFAIAHVEPDPDGDPIPHVVFDYVHAWRQGDFDSLEMDYLYIQREIKSLMDSYAGFANISFDQYNSISIAQELRRYAIGRYVKRVEVEEMNVTNKSNWIAAETTKMALALGKVHSPYYDLAEAEFKFLQKHPTADKVDHPDVGPVTTKDVYDAMSIVIQKTIGGLIAKAYGDQFASLKVGTSMPGPNNIDIAQGIPVPGANDVNAAFSNYNSGRRASRAMGNSPARGSRMSQPDRRPRNNPFA